jgi:DNA-binding HxlR family transcriptional regulator
MGVTSRRGAWSSQRHWHSHEDEFVWVLDGELTLVTDACEEILRAGDCAAFRRGDPDGHQVMESIEGISQKSLTKTLRQLERGGLVTRVVFPEVPPRVEYRITKLGEDLLVQLHPVWLWTVANVKRFESARSKYAGAGRTNHWIKPRVSH